MKRGTESKDGRTAAHARLKDEVHAELSEIAAKSGLSVARLLEIGAGLVIEQVKATGRVPMPEVKLDSEAA